jgi:predicted nuclease with TOPRIM domain
MMATTDQLLLRIEVIEAKLNDVQTAINNLASKQQLKQLLNIRQTEIDDLKVRVTSLEGRLTVLESAS